jgi:hypothetical protein
MFVCAIYNCSLCTISFCEEEGLTWHMVPYVRMCYINRISQKQQIHTMGNKRENQLTATSSFKKAQC